MLKDIAVVGSLFLRYYPAALCHSIMAEQITLLTGGVGDREHYPCCYIRVCQLFIKLLQYNLASSFHSTIGSLPEGH